MNIDKPFFFAPTHAPKQVPRLGEKSSASAGNKPSDSGAVPLIYTKAMRGLNHPDLLAWLRASKGDSSDSSTLQATDEPPTQYPRTEGFDGRLAPLLLSAALPAGAKSAGVKSAVNGEVAKVIAALTEGARSAPNKEVAAWQDWTVSIPEFPLDANEMIDAPLEEVLSRTAAQNRVTYLGDDHSMRSIRYLLQDSASDLKKAGVNTIFVEFIHQEDNEALQEFMKTGDEHAFQAALGKHSWKDPDLNATLQAFRRQGIKAIGIDVIAEPGADSGTHMQQRNLAWAKTINAIIEAEPETKAVVWGGAFHFDPSGRWSSVNSLLPGPVITFVSEQHMDIHTPQRAAYCSLGRAGDIVINTEPGRPLFWA